MKRTSNTSSLKEAIDRLLQAYRLKGKMIEIDAMNAWHEVMGEVISNKTDEVFVKDRILHVRLTSAALREELSYGKQMIVKNINEHLEVDYLKDAVLK